MIQVFKKENNSTVSINFEDLLDSYDYSDHWLHLSNPTDKEIEFISKTFNVEENLIKSSLDDEERPRIDYENNSTLILTDIPITEEDEDQNLYTYSTIPFGFINAGKTIITICLYETSIVNDLIYGRFIRGINIHKKSRFLLQLQYTISKKYIQYLSQVDKASQRIKNELEKSTKNKELIEMMNLEQSLVYFSTSLRSNLIVVEKLVKIIEMFDEDKELLDDVMIENKQAIEMANIYRDILSGTMDAYASIISNNLNVVMKVLTSITLILAIPALFAAFWGMNTKVPFQGKEWGFWVVVVLSLICSIVLAIVLWKKKLLK